MVCNFSPPNADGFSLNSHRFVLIWFHEFGHVAHMLINSCPMPMIAPTEMDYTELPS